MAPAELDDWAVAPDARKHTSQNAAATAQPRFGFVFVMRETQPQQILSSISIAIPAGRSKSSSMNVEVDHRPAGTRRPHGKRWQQNYAPLTISERSVIAIDQGHSN
jgi:hypothetical protein